MAAILTIFCLSLIGCGSGDDPVSPGGNNNGQFSAVLETGGDFEQPVPKNEVVASTSEPEPGPDGTFWVCTEKVYDFVSAPSQYANFNPSENLICPGNLMQGKTLANATPAYFQFPG